MRRINRSLWHALILAAGLLLACVATGIADVRLQDDAGGTEEPVLAIRLSPAGPWSLVRPLDATVLNPAGDSYSDGLPDDAAQGEDLLAAWVRPADGRVHLSHWAAVAWRPLPPFADTASIGVPRVDALGMGWTVTWQQLGDEPVILAGGVGAGGEHHDSEPLIDGWLLDVSWMNDIELILHQNPTRTALILTGVLWSVPGVPSPVDVVFSVELGPMDPRASESFPSPSLAPAFHPGGKKAERLHGIRSRRIAITWFSPEGELRQSIVDKQGDVHEVEEPLLEPGSGLTGGLVGRP